MASRNPNTNQKPAVSDTSMYLGQRFESEWLGVTLHSIGDAVIAADCQSVVTFMNPVAEALTGWKADEAIGQPLEDVFKIIEEATRLPGENPAARAIAEGAIVGLTNHTLLIAKDGAEVAIDDSAAPIRDSSGKLLGAVLIFRDITDRRKAERAVRESEERFRTLADAAPVLIWMADANKQAVYFNQSWLEFTGGTLEEQLGDKWMELVHPDDRSRLYSDCDEGFTNRQPFTTEFRMMRADGEYRWLLDTGTPRFDPDGRFVGFIGSCVDITDRKRAEETQALLAAIVESSDDAIISKTLKGIILSWNAGAERIFGYSAEEAIGKSIELIIPPELRHEERMILARLRRGERIAHFETQRVSKAGEWLDISLTISPIRDGRGRIIGASKVARNITERRRAEIALREHSQKIQTLLDTLPIGVLMAHDKQCRRITANRAGCELLKMPVGANASKSAPAGERPTHFRVLRNGEEVPTEQLPVQRAARGEEVQGEEVDQLFNDGTVLHLLAYAAPLRDGNGRLSGAIAGVLDVTERKRFEKSLRFLAEASKSLSTLVDYKSTLQHVAQLAVPHFAEWCAVDVVNASGELERVAIAHADPEKLKFAEEYHRRFPPDPDSNRGSSKVFRTGEAEIESAISDEMLRELARNDEHLQALRQLNLKSYMCVPLKSKGRSLGTLAFVSSEAGRRYDKADLEMASDLGHRAGIAIENARLYHELREADRRKDEFLAMLAHELRNPLAPIRTGLDILSLDCGDNRETVELMQGQLQHVVRLVDDLLDVSRIMQGRIELRKEPVELSALAERSADTVRTMTDERQQQLVVNLPEEPIWLHADPIRLMQVFENLLNNAAKYTDDRGRVELSVSQRKDRALVRVRDTGIGIDAELLPTIFDLFTQSSRTLDRAQGGLGIGLTLAQRLVEMHDGSIAAHSEGSGKGSEFIVDLPITKTVSQSEEAIEHQRTTVSRRILVVDDNVGAATVLAMLLKKFGDHQVETAYNGLDALEKIKQTHPEIVLLDIGLPGIDGYEVARTVRSIKEYDDVLLVALTGYGQEEDRRRSREAGFDKHLVKPTEAFELEAVLAEYRVPRD